MRRTDVITDAEITRIGNIKEAKNDVPAMVEEWNKKLEAAAKEKSEELTVPQMELSEKNSDNFQIIGMIYKTIYTFTLDNEYPKMIVFKCKTPEEATLYRQIYNWFIPTTKADRMPDDSWD